MYAVVAGAIPAAFRNVTALAMVIAWLSVELVYQITGDSLPIQYSFMADIAVLAVIFAKEEACNRKPYLGTWHQLKCILLERSVPDRIVMLIFPLMWCIYVAPISPYYVWYFLWALAIIQFLAAGYEGYVRMLHARKVRKPTTPILDRHLRTANVIAFPRIPQRRAAERVLLNTANGGGGSG